MLNKSTLRVVGYMLVACSAQLSSVKASAGDEVPTVPETLLLRIVILSPKDDLQKALNEAKPGDNIVLHEGEYTGKFSLKQGGTIEHPIKISAFQNEKPVIKGTLTEIPEDYSGGMAAGDRAISIIEHLGKQITDVTIEGIQIDGGILIGGHGFPAAWKNFIARYGGVKDDKSGPWQLVVNAAVKFFSENSVPYCMRGEYLGTMAKRIVVRNCQITRRGILIWHSSNCIIENNTIKVTDHNVQGIVLQEACCNNYVKGNNVSGMYVEKNHWNGEGIRLVNFSSCNIVERNYVHDSVGGGHGITADVRCDGNYYIDNIVERFNGFAYTDQFANAETRWIGNIARNCVIGFDIASYWGNADPSKFEGGRMVVEFNTVENSRLKGIDIAIGSVNNITLRGNSFHKAYVSPKLRDYWEKSGSSWDGCVTLPSIVSFESPWKKDAPTDTEAISKQTK